MRLGKPIAIIDYLPINWRLPYGDKGAAILVKRKNDLKKSIEELLFEKEKRIKIVKNIPKLIESELCNLDGLSHLRITDIIESQIN